MADRALPFFLNPIRWINASPASEMLPVIVYRLFSVKEFMHLIQLFSNNVGVSGEVELVLLVLSSHSHRDTRYYAIAIKCDLSPLIRYE